MNNINIPFHITNPFTRTYDHIKEAYYKNGATKVPSDKEMKAIESDIAVLDLIGAGEQGIGALGLGVTYIAWYIPYVGPLCGLVAGIVSIASIILGTDTRIASDNLKEFAEKKSSNVLDNLFSVLTKGTKVSRKKFMETIDKIACKRTFIFSLHQDYKILFKSSKED